MRRLLPLIAVSFSTLSCEEHILFHVEQVPITSQFSNGEASASYILPANSQYGLYLSAQTGIYEVSAFDSLRITITADVNYGSALWKSSSEEWYDSIVAYVSSAPDKNTSLVRLARQIDTTTTLSLTIPKWDLGASELRWNFAIQEMKRPRGTVYPLERILELRNLQIVGYRRTP